MGTSLKPSDTSATPSHSSSKVPTPPEPTVRCMQRQPTEGGARQLAGRVPCCTPQSLLLADALRCFIRVRGVLRRARTTTRINRRCSLALLTRECHDSVAVLHQQPFAVGQSIATGELRPQFRAPSSGGRREACMVRMPIGQVDHVKNGQRVHRAHADADEARGHRGIPASRLRPCAPPRRRQTFRVSLRPPGTGSAHERARGEEHTRCDCGSPRHAPRPAPCRHVAGTRLRARPCSPCCHRRSRICGRAAPAAGRARSSHP